MAPISPLCLMYTQQQMVSCSSVIIPTYVRLLIIFVQVSFLALLEPPEISEASYLA